MTHDELPSWRGIYPGITTFSEMLAVLGTPRSKSISSKYEQISIFTEIRRIFTRDGIYCYRDPTPLPYPPSHEIIVRSNLVECVKEFRNNRSQGIVKVSQLIGYYGEPELLAWSYRLTQCRALMFPSRGIIAHVSRSNVIWFIYFVPLDIEGCLSLFSREVSLDDPHYPSDDGSRRLDIWQGNWAKFDEKYLGDRSTPFG